MTRRTVLIGQSCQNTDLYAQWEERDDPYSEYYSFFRLDANHLLPKTGFSAVNPQPLTEKPLSLNYQPVLMMLEIPSASVTAEIVMVPFADGEFQVAWLDDKAGLLEGSSLPGEGQSVLTGHNHLNTTEYGPFAKLSGIEEGDRIFIRDEDDIRIFEVYANEKIAEDDIDAVNRLISEDPRSLTLITCENERIEGGYINRRIIAAKPL